MKKLLGGLLSLAMMFSLTPSTIALADHESADVGVESSQSQVDESVSSIQTRINNLVGVEGVTDENRDTVYKEVQSISSEYNALTSDQQSKLDITKLSALADYYNSLSNDEEDEDTVNVAQVGDAKYDSLQDAINSSASGSTITLLRDVTGITKLTVPSGKTLTLDLNGKTIATANQTNTKHYYAFDNYGSLTINDSIGTGKISSRGMDNYGTMMINSGTFETIDSNGGANVYNEPSCSLTIRGGTYKVIDGTNSAVNAPQNIYNEGEVLITGGNFESNSPGVYSVISVGNITITPSEGKEVFVSGVQGGLGINAGTATINGGNYSSSKHYGLYVSNDGKGGNPKKAAVTVNGGIFDGKEKSVLIGSDRNNPVNSTIEINDGTFKKPINAQNNTRENAIVVKGGTFASDVTEYLDEGLSCVKSNDTYTITVANKIVADDSVMNTISKVDTSSSSFDSKNVTSVKTVISNTDDSKNTTKYNESDAKKKLDEVVNDKYVEEIPFEVDLIATDSDGDTAKITELSEPTKLTMTLNDSTLSKIQGKAFKLYRIHNDKAEEIDATLDGHTLTFSSDKFSWYVLVVENVVSIDLSKVNNFITITPTGYSQNGGSEISFTGKYIFTGYIQTNTPIIFTNNSGNAVEYDVTFDNANIRAKTYCTAIAFRNSNAAITLNITNKGKSYVAADNHPAFANQTDQKVSVNVIETEGSSLQLTSNKADAYIYSSGMEFKVDGKSVDNTSYYKTGEVNYLDSEGKNKFVACEKITSDTSSLGEDNKEAWYVVSENVTNNNRIQVKGNVNIILANGVTLTQNAGIDVSDGSTLTFYGGTKQTGAINIPCQTTNYRAGINVNSTGKLVVNGGQVIVNGDWNQRAAIGTNYYLANGGTVEVNRGTLEATGGNSSALSTNLVVNGGTVSATTGNNLDTITGSVIVNGGELTVSNTNTNGKAISFVPTIGDGMKMSIGSDSTDCSYGDIEKKIHNGVQCLKITNCSSHNYEYSCKNGEFKQICSLCNKSNVIATLTANDMEYSGNAYAGATLTQNPDYHDLERYHSDISDISYSYTQKDGEEYKTLTSAPIDAGQYQVSATFTYNNQQYVVSKEFNITKIASSDITVRAKTLVYNGQEQELVEANTMSDGVVKYLVNNEWTTTIPKAKRAGDYTVTYKVFGDKNHSDGQEKSIRVTIAQKSVKVSDITTSDKTYDGNTTAEVDCSQAVFDGMVDGDKLTIHATGTFDGKDVGNHTVTLSNLVLGGDDVDNYVLDTDHSQKETTAKINAKSITATITSNGGTYNGTITGATVKLNGLVGNDNPTVTLKYNDSLEVPTNAGTYTVSATINDTNYSLGETKKDFVISKANPNLSVSTVSDKAYGDDTFKLDVKQSGSGALSYSSSNENVVKVDTSGNVSIVGAGSAKLTVSVEESDNYKSGSAEVTVKVVKKDHSLVVDKLEYVKTYGDDSFSLGATSDSSISYVSSNEDVVKVDSDGIVSIVGKGNATITATVDGDSNYIGVSKTVDVVVNAKDISKATVTLGNTLSYTGSEQTQEIKSVVVDGMDVTYSVSGNKAIDVGSHTLKITGTGNFGGSKEVSYVVVPTKAEQLKVNSDGKISYGKGTITVGGSVLNGKTDLLEMLIQDGSITVEQLKSVYEGTVLNVSLDVKDISSSLDEKTKSLMLEMAEKSGLTIGNQYLDISLFVNDTLITTTSGKVKASVVVPDSLINMDSNVSRTYYMVRYHDGEVSCLEGKFDEKTHSFTFETDKFSAYALAYKDTNKKTDQKKETKKKSTNTSVQANIGFYVSLLMVSMIEIFVLIKMKRFE